MLNNNQNNANENNDDYPLQGIMHGQANDYIENHFGITNGIVPGNGGG